MGKVRPMTVDESLLLMRQVTQFQRQNPGVQLDWQVIKSELQALLPGEFDLRQEYQNIKKKGIFNNADTEEYAKTPQFKPYEWTRLRNRGANSVQVAEDNRTQVYWGDYTSTAQENAALGNSFPSRPRSSDSYPKSTRLQSTEVSNSTCGTSSALIQTPARSPGTLSLGFGSKRFMEEDGIERNQPCRFDQPPPSAEFLCGRNGASVMADIELCLPYVTLPTLLSQTFHEYLNLSAHFENRQDRLNAIKKCVNMLKQSERDRIILPEWDRSTTGQISREMAVLKRTFGNQFDRTRALPQTVSGLSHGLQKEQDGVHFVPRDRVDMSGSTDMDDACHINNPLSSNAAFGGKRTDHGIIEGDDDEPAETDPNIRCFYLVKEHGRYVRVNVESLNASGILCVMLDPEPKQGARKQPNSATKSPVATYAVERKQSEPIKTSYETFSTMNAVCKKKIKSNPSTRTDRSVLETGNGPSQRTISPIAVEHNLPPFARPSLSTKSFPTPTTKEPSATIACSRDSEDQHSEYVCFSTRNASETSVSPFVATSENNQQSVSIPTTSEGVSRTSSSSARFNKMPAPMLQGNETPQFNNVAQKGPSSALERQGGVYRRQILLPDAGSKILRSNISGELVGSKLNTDEWRAIFRFALMNEINLCMLNPQEWKELLVKTGVKCCNTGETLMEQFYSISLPNLEVINGPGFAKINLMECNNYTLMVIYHSLVDVTCKHVQHVIEYLLSANILSAEKYDKSGWFKNFLITLFSVSHEQFGTDYLDFCNVKDALLEEFLNHVLVKISD